MGATTGIQWCHHTWSPWWGCTKVSQGCAHCYVEPLVGRFAKGNWGPSGSRRFFGHNHWQVPFRLNRAAAKAAERRRIFPSMCDIFEDRDDLVETRRRFFGVIAETPNLDWLILTKRAESAKELMAILVRRAISILGEYAMRGRLKPSDEALLDTLNATGAFPNIWLGVSVEDQENANRRLPVLRDIPAAVRFVSYEPALGPVDWKRVYAGDPQMNINALEWLDWLIVGGESNQNGGYGRPFDIQWARDAIAQCRAASVAPFLKQLGSRVLARNDGVSGWFDQCDHLDMEPTERFQGALGRVRGFRNSHGGDPSEWPEDLRDAREFPEVGRSSICGLNMESPHAP